MVMQDIKELIKWLDKRINKCESFDIPHDTSQIYNAGSLDAYKTIKRLIENMKEKN